MRQAVWRAGCGLRGLVTVLISRRCLLDWAMGRLEVVPGSDKCDKYVTLARVAGY